MRAAWFKAVIGMLAAIAVGVGAAVVAARFAPVAVVEEPVATVEATVLGGTTPLAEGAAEAPPEPEEAPEEEGAPGAPEPPATVSVPDPATLPEADPEAPPALAPEVAESLAASAASVDPFVIAERWPGLEIPTLDPCLLDPDAAGCPAGSSGVLLDGDVRPLSGRIESGTCSPRTGTNLVLDVVTNTPATEIRVTARSGSLVTEQTVTTSADWLERWTAEGAYSIRHCLNTEGWPRGADVDVTARIVDVFGREATVNATRTVPPATGTVRPDAQLLGMGVNMMRVSAPFAPGQTVRMGWVEPDQECAFGSDGGGTGLGWSAGRWVVEDIPEDYSLRNNWDLSYDQRVTADFVVPTSRTLRLCVGWYDGGEGDVAGRPQYRNEVVVHTPAAALPTATITALDLSDSLPDGPLRVSAALPGARCGAWTGPDGDLPATLCDVPAIAPWFGASGYLTISTETGGAANHFVIDAASTICAEGSCPARSQEFEVPILGARPGLCSSDCPDQPDYGTATVRVDWPASSGVSWWTFAESTTGGYDDLAGELPQMRTTAEWVMSGPDPTTGTIDAGFPLETDRPVTVRVTLGGDCFRPGVATTFVDDTLQQWAGARVTFADLCMGTRYLATVELTDADGDVSTTTFARGDVRFWPYASFATPSVVGDLVAFVRLRSPDATAYAVVDSRFGHGSRASRVATPGSSTARCFVTGDIVHRIDEVALPWASTSEFRVTIAAGDPGANPVNREGFADCTGAGRAPRHDLVVPIEITLDEMLAGSTVEYTDPETGVAVSIRLFPTLLR
jgi:hypothetical protein